MPEHKLYAPRMPTLYVVRHGHVASNPVDPKADCRTADCRGAGATARGAPARGMVAAGVFETKGNDIRLVERGRELKSKVS
jgi:hypothetical protein